MRRSLRSLAHVCLRAVIVDLPSDVHLPIGGFAVDATRRALLGATALGAGGLALMEVVAAAEAFTCFSTRECYARALSRHCCRVGLRHQRAIPMILSQRPRPFD